MIPNKDVIQLAADAGAELGAMEDKPFAIVFTPEQLLPFAELLFKMGIADACREGVPPKVSNDFDCRVCAHYCETNGCDADLCAGGYAFKLSAPLKLWEM